MNRSLKAGKSVWSAPAERGAAAPRGDGAFFLRRCRFSDPRQSGVARGTAVPRLLPHYKSGRRRLHKMPLVQAMWPFMNNPG